MKFNTYIDNIIGTPPNTMVGNIKNTIVSIYPVSSINLEGIKILIDNCMRVGTSDNENVEIATVSPSLWLGAFLDKHFDKIKFVTPMPSFTLTKVVGNEIIEKNYRCDSVSFNTEKEIDEFFTNGSWKTFVLFSITKIVDLRTMTTSYNLRYSDITEKFEERDNKLNNILDGTNNN